MGGGGAWACAGERAGDWAGNGRNRNGGGKKFWVLVFVFGFALKHPATLVCLLVGIVFMTFIVEEHVVFNPLVLYQLCLEAIV